MDFCESSEKALCAVEETFFRSAIKACLFVLSFYDINLVYEIMLSLFYSLLLLLINGEHHSNRVSVLGAFIELIAIGCWKLIAEEKIVILRMVNLYIHILFKTLYPTKLVDAADWSQYLGEKLK